MTQSGISSCERRGSWLFALLLTIVASVCVAGNVCAEGLADIYGQAQKNDPAIQSAYYKFSAIKEGRRQAIGSLLPTISASAEYVQTTQDIKSSDNTVFGVGQTDFDTQTYSLTLTQPVFNYGYIVGLKKSKFENRLAASEYALAQQELIVRVADLYLQALAAQDQLTFATSEQTAVEKHFELASGRYEMGLIPITDLHDAKARMATVQAQTIEAQNILDDTLQALQELTGEPIDSLKALRAEIPMLSPEPQNITSWIDGGVEQNPAVVMQRHAVDVARQEVRRQKTGHYPTLDLVGRYNSQETEGTLFGGGSEVDTTDIVLQMNLPIYQGGIVSSKVREAKHLLSAAQQELNKQLRAVERQTRSAFLGVKSSLLRVDALNQSVVSNQLALEAKQEGFLSGLYTSLNVLDAERDLALVSIDYAQARYSYILSSLKLKQAVGSLNSQDLLDLENWFQ